MTDDEIALKRFKGAALEARRETLLRMERFFPTAMATPEFCDFVNVALGVFTGLIIAEFGGLTADAINLGAPDDSQVH